MWRAEVPCAGVIAPSRILRTRFSERPTQTVLRVSTGAREGAKFVLGCGVGEIDKRGEAALVRTVEWPRTDQAVSRLGCGRVRDGQAPGDPGCPNRRRPWGPSINHDIETFPIRNPLIYNGLGSGK